MAKTNLSKALDILRGTTVVAHDRRKADAIAIDFTEYRYKGDRILSPVHGISNSMLEALTQLAKRVKYVGGMPRFIFNA